MTDINIEETRKLLQAEAIQVEARIKKLRADDPFSDPGYSSDNAAVDTDVREQEAHQRIEAEVDSLKIRQNDIRIALERLEKGRYGTCKRCNKPIPPKRLELIPETQYCVSCESEIKQ